MAAKQAADMALTQESVLSFLLERGGRVKNSELLNNFRAQIGCSDPAEKQHNRELFKRLVNSVAVVKQIDEVKFVVVRKRYRDFVREAAHADESLPSPNVSFSCTSPVHGGEEDRINADIENNNAPRPPDLNRSSGVSRVCAGSVRDRGPSSGDTTAVKVLNLSADQASEARRSGAVFAVIAEDPAGFEQARPPNKTARQGNDAKCSECVPLEPLAHEWLVKCAAGLWGHIYGLLLQDARLAQRRDFMSGFTALHWAAKDGNHQAIQKLMELCRKRGTYVNVNSKAHGGYTPLHIAAIHGRAEAMLLLVRRYGASVSDRDNEGKKAFHYLGTGASAEVRGLLGGAQPGTHREKTEDGEYREQSKGFNTISKLFQPHMGKKQKATNKIAPDW
uniref:SOWAHA-C winged helix-turn-helix domain-containing protein n=1 Tax=Mola mola TaxID=94237 RepID=A0A3Q4AMA1_MOLML